MPTSALEWVACVAYWVIVFPVVVGVAVASIIEVREAAREREETFKRLVKEGHDPVKVMLHLEW